MSSSKVPATTNLLPFQQQSLATNQQSAPLPYFRGTRLVAGRWISPALDHITQPAKSGGGKKG